MENTTLDVEKRLGIMMDAVNKAHDVSDKDESTLKVSDDVQFCVLLVLCIQTLSHQFTITMHSSLDLLGTRVLLSGQEWKF